MRLYPLVLCALSSSLLSLSAPAQEVPKENPPPAKPEGDRPAPVDKEAPASAKRTWIGIATAPMDHALREHLELPDGFGVQVIEIIPDSPADLSGLKSNDIITHFDVQHLISPEHLSLLVRSKTSGDKASLTIIRKGKEEAIEVTLGESEETVFANRLSPANPPPGHGFPSMQNPNDARWHESMQRQQDYWQDWMNKNRPEWRGNPSRDDAPQSEGEIKDRKTDDGRKPKDPADGHPTEARPPSVSVNPGFPLRVFGSEGILKIDNEKGELTLTRKNGVHTLEIEDAGGKVIYNGPFDPALGVEGLPEAAREQLEIMKLGNFEIHLPDAPVDTPEKARDPREATDKAAKAEEGPL